LLDLQTEIGIAVLTNSDSASPADIAEALLTVAYDDEIAGQQAAD
jgi:hypothetical protein